MTVKLLKDVRIQVKDPHDALLLSLAGVELRTHQDNICKFDWTAWKIFHQTEWYYSNVCDNITYCPLYVPADVARGLVTVDERMDGKTFVDWACVEHPEDMKDGCIMNFMDYRYQNFDVFMRRHNDRWNLLPDIEMEK